MQVRMTHDELLQACREWASKHHGLKVSGDPVLFVYNVKHYSDGDVAASTVLSWPVAAGLGDPYRTPADKE
jgi:hypothetical protein